MKGDLTMQAVARKMGGPPKGRTVGRRRTTKPSRDLPVAQRKFAEHLSKLVGDDSIRVAAAVGVTPDAVRKWCAGHAVPSLEYWPKLSAALGLADWRELLPPLRK
jgi:hypothetical protein